MSGLVTFIVWLGIVLLFSGWRSILVLEETFPLFLTLFRGQALKPSLAKLSRGAKLSWSGTSFGPESSHDFPEKTDLQSEGAIGQNV